MLYVLVPLAIVVCAIAAFIWWRWTSVERGARERDRRIVQILDPVGTKLADGKEVTAEEVRALADIPQVRPMLYALLKHRERLPLFPRQYLDIKSQGAAILAYWMMHPNELQDAPAEMELVEAVSRQLGDARGDFLVFRFRMAEGHWAAKDGWLLGLAGPFFENDVPHSGVATAFSRCGDKYGAVSPAELVDWFIGVAEAKSR